MITMSITEASRAGISALAAAAQRGDDIALARHGRVIAEVVGSDELADLRRDRDVLRDAALVMARFATDDGGRTELDALIDSLGFSRTELELELDGEVASDADSSERER